LDQQDRGGHKRLGIAVLAQRLLFTANLNKFQLKRKEIYAAGCLGRDLAQAQACPSAQLEAGDPPDTRGTLAQRTPYDGLVPFHWNSFP
jgi:hypothetical protein